MLLYAYFQEAEKLTTVTAQRSTLSCLITNLLQILQLRTSIFKTHIKVLIFQIKVAKQSDILPNHLSEHSQMDCTVPSRLSLVTVISGDHHTFNQEKAVFFYP